MADTTPPADSTPPAASTEPVDSTEPAVAAPARPTFLQRLRGSRAAVIAGAAALVVGLVGGGLIGHAIGERDHADRSTASESDGHGNHDRGHGSDSGDSTDSTDSTDSKSGDSTKD